MIRAVLLALVLDAIAILGFIAYTAGLVEGVTHAHTVDVSRAHTTDSRAAISRN